MTGLPTLQVLLDDGSGTFPYDLTNMAGKSFVLFAEGLNLKRGREDEQSAVTAGELSLTLNNADGRFSPGSTIIASPSPIKVDQRIRVKETINGTTFTRFTGYVKSWPVSWPAVVATHSTVSITVTDAQARAERQVLKSVIEQEILEGLPDTYYTLGEPAGSLAAADSSGNQAPMLAMGGSGTDVVFGNATGPGTDGLTAAEVSGGQYLTTTVPLNPALFPAFILAFATTDATATRGIFGLTSGPRLSINAGALSLSGTTVGSGGYNDGKVHVIEISYSTATSCQVFIDGVLTNTITVPAAVGSVLLGSDGVSATFIGSIAHFATWQSAITGSADRANAMLTGFAGESGTTRLTRLAGYGNLPIGTFDTSLTNVAFTDFTGRSVWDAIQEVADAEAGPVFFDGSGNLTFYNRNRSPAKTVPDLTLDRQYVTSDAQPTQDDQQIKNYIETIAVGTGVTQVVTNAASETSHGRYPDSKSYLVQSDAEALDRANWTVTNHAEPSTRFGTLTIDLYRMTPAQAAAVLAAIDLGAWLRVTSMPAQTPGSTTVDVVIEGYAEEATATSWRLRCNVSARQMFTAWILGDSVRGVLGSTTRLYI